MPRAALLLVLLPQAALAEAALPTLPPALPESAAPSYAVASAAMVLALWGVHRLVARR